MQNLRVPGRSTMYRHRLTFHQGFCRWLGKCARVMLSSSGGVTRWGTLDSSPQGSFDWLLTGASTMCSCDLSACYRDANRLIALGQGPISDEACDEQKIIHLRLSPLLQIVQGVPTAVGSGRASVKYKIHSMCHSTRLTSWTWEDTAELINSTATWTGDLGTESGVNKFRGNLRTLFGAWVAGAADEQPPPDAQPDL